MAYDRDEWRNPWRTAEPAEAAEAAEPDGVASAAVGEATGVGQERTDVPAAGPIARYPQPPPSGWDATAAGPGSPPGSVRPPDTTGTHDAPPRTRRGRTFLTAVIGGLIGALVGGGLVAAVVGDVAPLAGSNSAPTIQVNGGQASVVTAVAEAVLPSVVSIDVPAEEVDPSALSGEGSALGSGVIYRSDGYILTNNHVVGEASDVTVRLASGDVFDGEVVGTDPLNDLAVIRIDAEQLPAVNIRGDEDGLSIGETVVAIGSPFGLEGTVTTGIVSGLNRDLPAGEEEGAGLVIPSVIQTDAAINPGNSGGALVDGAGNLIGINTAIFTRTGSNSGVGFAVPVGQAVTSADQIIEQGFVRHSLLGISGLDVSPEIAEEFGLDAPRGAIVEAVQDDTGAADAGMQSGDIIIAVDGEPLATMSQLVAEVRSRAPGDEVTLTVVRDGSEVEVDVVLTERPRP